MDNCLFCRIIAGEIPSPLMHDGEHVVAFSDINPQAPTHVLVIPKREIAMWVTRGPTSDRPRERVGASDLAIVEFRRLMVEAAREMQAGGPALGTTDPHIPQATISAYEGVVPKGTDWRKLRPGQDVAAKERVA